MPASKKGTTDAVEILHRRFHEGNPARLESLEQTRANEEIARKIRALRTKAGLTQDQLAKVVGTTSSAICRLEDADYEGHSVAMLRVLSAEVHNPIRIAYFGSLRAGLTLRNSLSHL
jgi:DNA-binding XRE family transcriptional regulator